MKRMVLLLVGAAMLPALAIAADRKLQLKASVQKYCRFDGTPTFSGTMNASTSASVSGGTITIQAGAAAGSSNSFSFSVMANATCNAPSSLVLTSLGDGLRGAEIGNGGGVYQNVINYTASVGWANGTLATITTKGGSGPVSTEAQLSTTASSGSLVVNVTATAGRSVPILAGTFADTIRISLTPTQ